MAKSFWRNVIVIALAHVALITGLICWSLAAKDSPRPDSIVWLGSTADVATGQSKNKTSPTEQATSMPEPLNHEEAENEKPAPMTARSEIMLPSPTPKPTSTETPMVRPTVTVAPDLKPTPKPARRLTPKKALVAKASPKPSPKAKPRQTKQGDKSEENKKTVLAKNESQSQSSGGKTGSTEQNGSAGGGSSASKFAWYGNMLHDRFYRAWIQPTKNVGTSTRISTLVRVRIEKDGRVSKFEIVKPSGNAVVNESVRLVEKQVTQVDAPPLELIKGDHYDVRINFELNTEDKTEN
ncbi:MAG TPA: TonB C-terminal domain-containing protein [Candidatus Udaeobacter sp.]|nr:TonB C-terminal domain-containing protein [Candidatus Udaeobacter sp.]